LQIEKFCFFLLTIVRFPFIIGNKKSEEEKEYAAKTGCREKMDGANLFRQLQK